MSDTRTDAHVDLLRWRKEFPILENTTYLINHSLGAMPRKVYDALKEYADIWATRGIRAWAEGWWASPVTTGNLLAKIFDAPEGSVVMHQNVSVIGFFLFLNVRVVESQKYR